MSVELLAVMPDAILRNDEILLPSIDGYMVFRRVTDTPRKSRGHVEICVANWDKSPLYIPLDERIVVLRAQKVW